ncbi:MAG: Rrf2 family transcriptional regulator [Candidatus Omnitrophica bacterium]|nr:Rrf2 family transcriptional regulator [Candidatus Omnitrophota bacterium]
MKLSTRSTYGMRALVELALAEGRGPVSAAAIAKRQDLSVAYLEQLLHRLKKRRVVTSIRGPRGGYVLAKEPARITMAEVVLVLDGLDGANGASVPNGRPSAKAGRAKTTEPKDAHRHAQRIAQAVWRCVHERLTQSLGTITLQDLCDEVRAQTGEPLDHRYEFHI